MARSGALGQTLNFSEGSVDFIGAGIADPALHLSPTRPPIILSHDHCRRHGAHSEDHPEQRSGYAGGRVLAQIMFDRSTSQLSPIEFAQIAAALASFSAAVSAIRSPTWANRWGWIGCRWHQQRRRGDCRLGNMSPPGFSWAPAERIGCTQAALQFDITKGLKLETTAGMGGAIRRARPILSGSSVGLPISSNIEAGRDRRRLYHRGDTRREEMPPIKSTLQWCRALRSLTAGLWSTSRLRAISSRWAPATRCSAKAAVGGAPLPARSRCLTGMAADASSTVIDILGPASSSCWPMC